MKLKKIFNKTAAVFLSLPALTMSLLSSCAFVPHNLTPQIESEMAEGVRMTSPQIPHKEALVCLAKEFNTRYPEDRLVVTRMSESSGKFSEEFGFYLPQDPHVMLETLLTETGFRVGSRDQNFTVSLTERKGMQVGLVDNSYQQKITPVTLGLSGAVTGLEFAVVSNAAKAGVGPLGLSLEGSRGKMSVDIKAVDLETGANLWANSSSVSFQSIEGGPDYHDFVNSGVLGLDNDIFLIGIRAGRTPSLSDLIRAGMAKAVYETLAPFVQEGRNECDQSVERNLLKPQANL